MNSYLLNTYFLQNSVKDLAINNFQSYLKL